MIQLRKSIRAGAPPAAERGGLTPALGQGREAREAFDGRRSEVVLRQCRIGFPIAVQETSDIAPVLAREAVRRVFRMALEEYEQAAALAHEQVDPDLGGAPQHRVAVRRKIRLGEIVQPRMRNGDGVRKPGEERVGRVPTPEDAGMLGRQRPAPDAVEVEHGGVSGEAGEECRDRAGRGPIDDGGQPREERLVLQPEGLRLAAGEDQGVETGLEQGVFGTVARIDLRPNGGTARQIAKREERERILRADQRLKLPLSLNESRVGHRVQETDPQRRCAGRRCPSETRIADIRPGNGRGDVLGVVQHRRQAARATRMAAAIA